MEPLFVVSVDSNSGAIQKCKRGMGATLAPCSKTTYNVNLGKN
jgi:hypothetical protein